MKNILSINTLAMVILLASSANHAIAKKIQLGYPSAKSIEEARFSLTRIETDLGTKLKIIGECDECPKELFVNENSGLENSEGVEISMENLRDIGIYESTFISFNDEFVVYTIRLK